MTDIKGRSPRDPNPWYRGSKRYGDLGRHAPPGDELENTRDHERIWHELGNLRSKGGINAGPWVAPTLINSWINAGPPYDDIAYRLIGDDVLAFKGHITGGASGSIAFYLDSAYWPDKDLSTITNVVSTSLPGSAQIYIKASDGSVTVTVIPT